MAQHVIPSHKGSNLLDGRGKGGSEHVLHNDRGGESARTATTITTPRTKRAKSVDGSKPKNHSSSSSIKSEQRHRVREVKSTEQRPSIEKKSRSFRQSSKTLATASAKGRDRQSGGEGGGSGSGDESKASSRKRSKSLSRQSERNSTTATTSTNCDHSGGDEQRRKHNHNNKSSAIADLESEILQLGNQLKRASKEKRNLAAEHEKEMESKEMEIQSLRAENAKLASFLPSSNEINKLQADNAKLLKQVRAWIEEHGKLQTKCQQLSSQNAKLLAERIQMQQELSTATQDLTLKLNQSERAAQELLIQFQALQEEQAQSKEALEVTLFKNKQQMELLDHQKDLQASRIAELEAALQSKTKQPSQQQPTTGKKGSLWGGI